MATLKKVRDLAAELGATVDHTETATIVDAPKGKTWASDPGVHGMTEGHNQRYDGRTATAYGRLIGRMKMGLTECTDSDCEVCRE